ncbi:MAG TPA: FtsX-like permease family protein [Candidatus Paceibacterota bacterium]
MAAKKKAHVWRVGFFLAYRQVKRASLWTTALIIAVMTLTFLNLVVVNGVLVGLIESSVEATRDRGTGDVVITTLQQKNQVERSQDIQNVLRSLPEVKSFSARYLGNGVLNADYRRLLRQDESANSVGVTIAGIDPLKENAISRMSEYVVEGSYLQPNDPDGILIGSNFLFKYTPIEVSGFQTLKDVEIGKKLKLTVGSSSKEVIVRGFVKSKVDSTDFRVFMIESEVRKMIGRSELNVNEISIKLASGATEQDALRLKQILLNNGFDVGARIQTYVEAQPKFLKDMSDTFGLLGNMIGSIGLAVASITIFIVIFVNAITRRKFIGILKGIGISPKAIEVSYIIQSIFYAVTGSLLGLLVLYGFLVPYIYANPIDFPFSDGYLYAPLSGTMIRVVLLITVTVIAGYIPARMIVKKNTLDAILGR